MCLESDALKFWPMEYKKTKFSPAYPVLMLRRHELQNYTGLSKIISYVIFVIDIADFGNLCIQQQSSQINDLH